MTQIFTLFSSRVTFTFISIIVLTGAAVQTNFYFFRDQLMPVFVCVEEIVFVVSLVHRLLIIFSLNKQTNSHHRLTFETPTALFL